MTPLVDLRALRFSYGGDGEALRGVDLSIAEGEYVAVVGPNGSGKSTLARIVAALEEPGTAERADVCGHDLRDAAQRRAARRQAGILFQDPESQVVGATVEEDVAFGLENLGLPAAEIGARVDEMVTRFALQDLREREPHLLSGGQQQRTALAGVLAVPRRLIVLDEPTAMLDAHGREEVLGAVRLLGEQGLTLMAVTQEMDELPAASRVVALEAGRVAFLGSPAELFDDAGLLGRLSLGVPVAAEVALRLRSAGTPMSRLPLTIEDLVTCLTKAGVPSASQRRLNGARGETAGGAAVAWRAPRRGAKADGRRRGLALRCERLSFGYGGGATTVPALSEVSFSIAAGSSTALLGPSGAGKSTLLLLLRGLLGPDEGLVEIDGENAESPEHRALQRRVGIVFQRPEVQLFATTVAEDVAFGPRQLGWAEEDVGSAVEESLEAVGLPRSGYGERHPYSLSGGEQRRAALAGVLAMRPGALLLDEPFMSLDPGGRRDLAAVLRRLKQDGTTLVLVTHDVDQAWELCDERLILTAGRLLSHGPWVFDEAGAAVMRTAGLPLPALVDLWRRLDLPADRAPRTAAAAADMLAGVIAAGAGSTRLPRGEGKP